MGFIPAEQGVKVVRVYSFENNCDPFSTEQSEFSTKGVQWKVEFVEISVVERIGSQEEEPKIMQKKRWCLLILSVKKPPKEFQRDFFSSLWAFRQYPQQMY